MKHITILFFSLIVQVFAGQQYIIKSIGGCSACVECKDDGSSSFSIREDFGSYKGLAKMAESFQCRFLSLAISSKTNLKNFCDELKSVSSLITLSLRFNDDFVADKIDFVKVLPTASRIGFVITPKLMQVLERLSKHETFGKFSVVRLNLTDDGTLDPALLVACRAIKWVEKIEIGFRNAESRDSFCKNYALTAIAQGDLDALIILK